MKFVRSYSLCSLSLSLPVFSKGYLTFNRESFSAFWGTIYKVPEGSEKLMNNMNRSFSSGEIKEIVYDALKQYPSAIPWFRGIYEDWTIGHLKYDLSKTAINFSSENFTEQKFFSICSVISNRIGSDISLEILIGYADFNNELGRLVVKQIVDFVIDLTRDTLKHDTFYNSGGADDSEGADDSNILIGVPEYFFTSSYYGGGVFIESDDDDDDEEKC